MAVSYKSDFTPRNNTLHLIINHLSDWYYTKHPENLWKIILPVKLGLGFRDKGEHYIEIPYDKFISEVTDVWEERKPIEGFKFDVEPIVYLKKDGIWLVEE